MTSIFTFASPWALSAYGRDELLRTFRASGCGFETFETTILPENSSAELISMQCTEKCFNAFVEFALKFYNNELAQEIDVFEEPKFIRISGTLASGTPSFSANNPKFTGLNLSQEVELEQLIQHEKYTMKWTPPHQDDQGNLTSKILPSVIGRIEAIAHVRLERFSNKDDLMVIGDTETAVVQATRKLSVLGKAMTHQFLVHNYPIVEDEAAVQLCFLPLREIPDCRMKTTLLSPQSPQYKSLLNSYALVVVKDGVVKTVVQTTRIADSLHPWYDHQLSVHLTEISAQNSSKATPISKWIDESNAAQIVDPFTPFIDGDSKIKNAAKSLDSKPSPAISSIKRVRKVKGSTNSIEEFDHQLQSNESAQQSEGGELRQLSYEHLSLAEEIHQLTIKEGEEMTHDLAVNEYEPRQPWAQLHIAESSRSHLPDIRPPFMPPQSMSSAESWEPDHYNWEHHIAEKTAYRMGKLIDLDPPKGSSQKTEAGQHKTHRTMGQKKPQIMTTNHHLVKCFENHVYEMLCSVTARPHAQISVSLGRMLIDRQTIPPEFRKKPFGIREWPHAASHLQTEFSARLTTNSCDIANIIDVKLQKGRRLLQEKPIERNIVYVIECLTKRNEQIEIEVREDGYFTIRGIKMLNGALNWHFAKRAWDARFQLTSREFIGGKYTEEAQSIAESIKVIRAANGAGVSISFLSKESYCQVQSMTLRREIVHESTMYPSIRLHITEVQDLNMSQTAENMGAFIGTIEPQEEMAINHRLWWEATISSQYAVSVLKQNETLEVGEEAEWKPESIVEQGVVKDMYALAHELVTRIDHIGTANKGPVTSGSKDTTKPSAKSHELPTGQPGYW